jgi:hypothetical protein
MYVLYFLWNSSDDNEQCCFLSPDVTEGKEDKYFSKPSWHNKPKEQSSSWGADSHSDNKEIP